MLYQEYQNGPFNGPLATDLVDRIRELDVPATGQSSWGPCIYAITPSLGRAEALSASLREYLQVAYPDVYVDVILTKADNLGGKCESSQSVSRRS